MLKPLLLLASILALSASVGCSSVDGPRWFGPGTAGQQRAEAARFDPYPENDTGPAVVGGRPRDYQNPVAEPSRARWNPLSWFSRQRPAAY